MSGMDNLITENNSPKIWWTISIQFGNPYKDPPNGWPRLLWAACCERPIDIKDLCGDITMPPGYTICYTPWDWTKIMKPESLLKMRRSRVEGKIAKRTKGMFPFAAVEIRERIWAKFPSDYLDCEVIRQRQEARAEYQREFITEKTNEMAEELRRINDFPEISQALGAT